MVETIVAPVGDAPKTPPPITRPPDHQTPIVHKTVTQPFSMDASRDMKDIYEKIAFDTGGHYFVGLEPDSFLEEFLPWNASTPDPYRRKCPSKQRLKDLRSVAPERGQKESVMYKPFVNALDGWVTKAALLKAHVPNPQTLRFLNTNLPDVSCNNLNPDISTYWSKDFTEQTNFSRQQTHQEFKPDLSHDPFQHVSDEGRNEGKTKTTSADENESVVMDEVTEEEESEEEEEEEEEEEDNHHEDDEEDEDEVDVDVDVERTGADVGLYDGDIDNDLLPEEAQEEESHEKQPPEEEYVALNDDAQKPTPSTSVETNTMAGIHTRGQIAVYAGLGLSMSFRKHFFSILILGRYARFIRWDRRGAVVTHRFDYTKRPRLIFDFYLLYCQLTLLQRGFDPTVELYKKRLPKSVREAFERYHQSTWYGGARFKRGDAPLSFEGFFRMEVTDDEKKCTETFFIPPPRYARACMFPFYRATRRSLACPYQENVEKPTMCFLKDSWQEESQRTDREAVIYRMLKNEGVKHVASMRLGGDVDGLETETQEWTTELSSNSKRLKRKMVCHRIILDTVARDLSTFSWCKVLLSCIADAVEGAQQAYKAGILHRDLSAGNIMIVKDRETKEWRGVLIDWDMCLLWKKREGEGPRSGRTGTWAFISARLLQNEGPVTQTLWDDMESALWVFIYEALLYLKHNKHPHLLSARMQRLFADNISIRPGEVFGGDDKMNVLLHCWTDQSDTLTQFEKPGVNEILNELGEVFYHRYHKYRKDKQPSFDLDDPDQKWFSHRLRDAAMKMEPLCVTPTGLQSPTNDSRPPDDPGEWKPASINDSKMDYYLMPISGNVETSTKVQMRQASEISSGFMHGLDGSFLGSKRSHISETADEEEPVSKRQRRRTRIQV